MRHRLILLLANGFGLGLSPVASGTVGTLPGVLVLMALAPWPLPAQIAVAALLAAAAVPVADAAERHYGRKDDGRIVVDEYLTFPLAMLGLPWAAHPSLLVVGFVVARVMDIVKLPPARQSQRLRGGLGIVIDDVIASLYALALNHLFYRCVFVRWAGT